MLSLILTFIAFLLLLVSLSVPIIKSIFLFRVTADLGSSLSNSGARGVVNFGVWGYCIPAIDISIIGIDRTTTGSCSNPSLGYTFDKTVSSALQINDLKVLVSAATMVALVLHPVAAIVTFVVFLASSFVLRRPLHRPSRKLRLSFVSFALTAALTTNVAFLIDAILVAVVRGRVHSAFEGGVTLIWGNAVWMALGATIALWLVMLGVEWEQQLLTREAKYPAESIY